VGIPTQHLGPVRVGPNDDLESVVRQVNLRIDLIHRYLRAIIGETRGPNQLDQTLADV
jgi:hypothetical protein